MANIQVSNDMTLEQRLAKQGKLYRAISTIESTQRVAITFEIPAGKYIQITDLEARINSTGAATGTATLKVQFGGTRSNGTEINGYNFNSINPRFVNVDTDIDVWREATITTPDQELTLTTFAVRTTSSDSSNETYTLKDISIFGDPSSPFTLTVDFSCDVLVEYMGLLIKFVEIDKDGFEI